MKNHQNLYRSLIAGGSLLGFLGGWALLAHAPKPVSASAQTQNLLVELAPVPTLEPLNLGSGRRIGSAASFNSFAQSRSFAPRLRTRGS